MTSTPGMEIRAGVSRLIQTETRTEVMRVLWRVDGRALDKALNLSPVNGQSAPPGEGSLELLLEREIRQGEMRLKATATVHTCRRDGSIRVYTAEADEISWIDDGKRLVNIDIHSEEWSCALTVQRLPSVRLRYARTDLMQRLGVGGGQYEPLSVELSVTPEKSCSKTSAIA